ncbi:hypothetical protein KUTeg_006830 [Tegillarca granosa]|uniref:Uncharacterized protein n=1 Tax=Tegillarca granosa TaxID=220873 RepID=A0ABQ9FEH8_TEGGR|nr:hypothetical protein KUTeg_006830 [Tegillarca granosa]
MEDDNTVSVEDKDENKENIVKETKFDLSATQVIADGNKPTQPSVDSRPVSRRVEIERIKSGYSERSHNESNLPNVLNEYGLSSADERLRGYHKDKKKKKKAADKTSLHDEESKEKLKKKREERYQLMMSELQNQSDVASQFFSRRISGIMERVDKQQKGDLSPRKPTTADNVDGKRPDRNKFKKKLERHELKHDSSFLREIPKTDIAKIVEIQEKLMREGKLKTQGDRDKFWEDMRNPEVLNSYFRNNNKFAESSAVYNHNKPIRQSGMADNTNKGTRDGWAVTQQVQHKYDPNKEIVVNTVDFV